MIKRIVLETNGKEISLSWDEAKELYQELEILFGKTEKEYIPYPYNPYPIEPWKPIQPYYTGAPTTISTDSGDTDWQSIWSAAEDEIKEVSSFPLSTNCGIDFNKGNKVYNG